MAASEFVLGRDAIEAGARRPAAFVASVSYQAPGPVRRIGGGAAPAALRWAIARPEDRLI